MLAMVSDRGGDDEEDQGHAFLLRPKWHLLWTETESFETLPHSCSREDTPPSTNVRGFSTHKQSLQAAAIASMPGILMTVSPTKCWLPLTQCPATRPRCLHARHRTKAWAQNAHHCLQCEHTRSHTPAPSSSMSIAQLS